MAGRRRRRPFSWKKLPAFLLLGVASLGLAWIVVSAALGASFSPRFAQAAVIAPNNPDIAFRLASAEFAASGGELRPDTQARLRAAAAADPLAADPFFFRAAELAGQGDAARARVLLEEARRRNPRHRLARLMLVEHYIREGRVSEATQEIAVLARLITDSRELLVTQLARLARDPATRDPVRRALAGDPLLEPVLAQLARDGADADVILGLAQTQGPRPAEAGVPEWQRLLVASLVERGQVDTANRLWAQFSGQPERGRATPYDAEFRGLPGTAPFNWTLSENETGSAEISRGKLNVDYFGRNSGELASQLMMLAPGRYRIAFQAEGGADGRGSKIVWHVLCHRPQAPAQGAQPPAQGGEAPAQAARAPAAPQQLLEIPVVGVTSAPRAFRAEFTVPAGCNAQWLRLEGISAEFPTTQSVEISRLSINRAGNGA